MKILSRLTTAAFALMISSTAWAQGYPQNMDPAMMQEYMRNSEVRNQQMMQQMEQQRMQNGVQNGMPMMDPIMRQNMMQMRQQNMGQGGMPMMGGNKEMMMDPMMRQNMMQQNAQKGEHCQHDGKMNHGMKHNKHMKQKHMANVEQRLQSIEARLDELVELMKKK